MMGEIVDDRDSAYGRQNFLTPFQPLELSQAGNNFRKRNPQFQQNSENAQEIV